MNIIVEEKISKVLEVLEVGDIVNIDGYLYFVVVEGSYKEEYKLRRFEECGWWRGYNGHYDTLEDLTNSIEGKNVVIHSRKDYELVLRRK